MRLEFTTVVPIGSLTSTKTRREALSRPIRSRECSCLPIKGSWYWKGVERCRFLVLFTHAFSVYLSPAPPIQPAVHSLQRAHPQPHLNSFHRHQLLFPQPPPRSQSNKNTARSVSCNPATVTLSITREHQQAAIILALAWAAFLGAVLRADIATPRPRSRCCKPRSSKGTAIRSIGPLPNRCARGCPACAKGG